MSTTTIRSTRLVQAFVAFAAAMSLAGGLSALAADDANAMRCELRGAVTPSHPCGDGSATELDGAYYP